MSLVSGLEFQTITKGLKVYSKSVSKGYSTPKAVAGKLKTFDCLVFEILAILEKRASIIRFCPLFRETPLNNFFSPRRTSAAFIPFLIFVQKQIHPHYPVS